MSSFSSIHIHNVCDFIRFMSSRFSCRWCCRNRTAVNKSKADKKIFEETIILGQWKQNLVMVFFKDSQGKWFAFKPLQEATFLYKVISQYDLIKFAKKKTKLPYFRSVFMRDQLTTVFNTEYGIMNLNIKEWVLTGNIGIK